MSSSPLFSLCTFWAFVLLSRHALLSAPLLLGEFFCVFFFFLSSPLRQMLSRGLSRTFSFQEIFPVGAAARSEPYSADLHFHCQFIPFPSIHSFPLNVCMLQFSLLFFPHL